MNNITKTITLEGSRITSIKEFHDVVREKLKFPDYYGNNLNAFWDVMTTDVGGPLEIIWLDAAISKTSLGEDFDEILVLFDELKKERPDFNFSIKY